jgi:hypothetical protein
VARLRGVTRDRVGRVATMTSISRSFYPLSHFAGDPGQPTRCSADDLTWPSGDAAPLVGEAAPQPRGDPTGDLLRQPLVTSPVRAPHPQRAPERCGKGARGAGGQGQTFAGSRGCRWRPCGSFRSQRRPSTEARALSARGWCARAGGGEAPGQVARSTGRWRAAAHAPADGTRPSRAARQGRTAPLHHGGDARTTGRLPRAAMRVSAVGSSAIHHPDGAKPVL